MSTYHEPPEEIPPKDRDIIRALRSLKEEIEAIEWYHQRVVTCSDEQLKKILAHNRDEEMEHACMSLEWLRRVMPRWDEYLRTYIFANGDIVDLEDGPHPEGPVKPRIGDVGVGSLKK
ncbi:MAG: ferritin-like domain-containing protein [Calditrichia bacterium]